MRLPKVLAVATVTVLATGAAAAAATSTGGGGHRAAADPVLIAGTTRGVTAATRPVRTPSTAPAPTTVTRVTAPPPSAPKSAGRLGSTGLSVPAAGVPLASGLDPALPNAPTPLAAASNLKPVQLPTPMAGSLPTVPPLASVEEPDAVVMLTDSLTADQEQSLRKLQGVKAIEIVDTGTVLLGGAPVVAFGVDPGSFRSFTPAASATSDQLWQYLAGGSLVSSYEMATDRNLQLGVESQVIPSSSTPTTPPVEGWLGAFASLGLPGVDLLVASQFDRALGLTPSSGLVVSAPGLDGATLEGELQKAVPGAAVELLHANQFAATVPGNVIGATVRQRILSAALSRVGLPYVWGATGPGSFDCSGLVQWSFRQAGVLMPRVAAEQFLTGDHIPLSAAQPGDLLFWTYDPSDPGYVDHVAIYLGNGLMVVAPHTGTNVEVTTVPTADFAGAVQVVLANS